jgi:hypothetical protein
VKDIKEYRLENFYLTLEAINTVTLETKIHIYTATCTHTHKKRQRNEKAG